jgi:hypothetical protein
VVVLVTGIAHIQVAVVAVLAVLVLMAQQGVMEQVVQAQQIQ